MSPSSTVTPLPPPPPNTATPTNGVVSPPTVASPQPLPRILFGKAVDSGGSWILFAVLSAIVAGLAHGVLVPKPEGGTANALVTVLIHPSEEARIVVTLLVVIWSYTLFATAQNAVRLRAERKLLNDLRQTLPATPDTQVASLLQTKLSGAENDTLLVQAVQSVWDARQIATPDLEAISASLAGLAERKSGVGAGVGNRLMLLSLLGTVLGLAQVISTLDPQIKAASVSGDVDAIFKNLNNTLIQMGTAFSSTAWGILLSTVLSWATATGSAARQDYVARVQHFAVAELAPRLVISSPAAAIDSFRNAILQGERLLTDVRATVEQSTKTQTLMADTLRDAHTAIRTETQSFVQKVEAVFVQNAAQFAQNMQHVATSVVAGAQAQSDAATQLDTLLRESTADLANAADSLHAAATVVSGLDASISRMDGTAKQMNTDLVNVAPQLQTLFAAQANTLAQANKQQADSFTAAAVEQSQAADARLTRQEAAFAQGLSALNAELSQAVRSVQTLVTAVQPRLPSPAELDKLRTTIDALTKAADAMTRGGMADGRAATVSDGSVLTPMQWRQAMSEALDPLLRQLHTLGTGMSSGPVADNSELI